MRAFLATFLVFVLAVVIVIPSLIVRGCTSGGYKFRKPGGSVIKVFNHQKNRIEDIGLEEYIKGVVAAEMPASFEIEALKAQAILARTYVVRRIVKGQRVSGYPEAVISTDPQNAQAWMSKNDLQQKWGIINYLFNWNRISRAVESTEGQVLTYQGELIEALYHSNAGGMTEDPIDVWGNSVPYLKPVISEYDKLADKYRQEFNFTWDELDKLLGTNFAALDLEREKEMGLFEILEKSSTNRILQIKIDGSVFTGRDLRERLGLPSTKLEISPFSEGLKFITYGNGHGVGMSQYGANGMAKNGFNYVQILEHFYPGTKIARLKIGGSNLNDE